jgi:hypothetical protein
MKGIGRSVRFGASRASEAHSSHLEKLHLVKDEILRDLSEIETDKAAVRATRLVSPRGAGPRCATYLLLHQEGLRRLSAEKTGSLYLRVAMQKI